MGTDIGAQNCHNEAGDTENQSSEHPYCQGLSEGILMVLMLVFLFAHPYYFLFMFVAGINSSSDRALLVLDKNDSKIVQHGGIPAADCAHLFLCAAVVCSKR